MSITHSQALLLMKLSLFERMGKKAREEGKLPSTITS